MTPATLPGAPTIGTATHGNTQVAVTWTAPASNGGDAITGYTVTSSPGGFTCTTAALTCTVSGLTNGTAHTFTVTATNTVGTGSASSASAAATPATVPGAPTGVTPTRGNTQVSLTWTAPVSDGGDAITGYTVTSSPGGFTCTTAALTCTVTGLTNGTAYAFTVTATNTVGTGSASSATASVTPATVPGAPTVSTATRGDAQVSVSWTAPVSDGGDAVTAYTVTSSPGGFTCTTASLTCTVTGLTNGTSYAFTVTATNTVGTGPASSVSASVIPATVPGAPTMGTATRGDAQVSVSWTAPVSDGGDAVTAYTVTSSPGGFTCTTASLTCTVTGLTNGTAYTFTVTATNTVGTGSASASSASVTPDVVPGAPTGVSATGGDTQASVSWTAPTANGGTAITGYTVTSSPGGLTCTTASLTCTVTGLTNGTPYTFTVTATNLAGSGAVSAPSAAVTPATVPDAPTGVSGARGDTLVSVSWSAPVWDGGTVITDYTVTSSPDGLTCTGSAPALTCDVTGLTNGTAYTFTVTATNAAGTGAASAPSAAVTPATVPNAPTGVTGARGDGLVSVSWTAPVDDGGDAVTGYAVTSSLGGLTCTTVAPTVTCDVTGLTNGTAYTFTVTATNTVGTSIDSAASAAATPVGVPGAPTLVSLAAGSVAGVVNTVFTAPIDAGGHAIYSYVSTCVSPTGGVRYGVSHELVNPPSGLLHGTIYGLTAGVTYTCTVSAYNTVFTGPVSNAMNFLPDRVPGAPTTVVAAPGDSQATISWADPVPNGGSAVTGYSLACTHLVSGSPVAVTVPGVIVSPVTVTGLDNGTTYTCNLWASNAAGDGAKVLKTVVPRTTPDAPTGASAIGGNATATVSWVASAGNGGSAITGYKVTSSPGAKTCVTTVSVLSCAVVGLTNGTAYTFTVTATNVAGTSAASDPTTAVTPMTVPGKPTLVTGVRADSQVSVSWAAPASNGGSTITDYLVTAGPGGATCATSGALSCVVPGLTNGTGYTFTVVATNAVGAGLASAASAVVTPSTTPGAPTAVSAVPGVARATVSWTAPASNGGAAITGYKVTSSPGGKLCTSAATVFSCSVTGLTNTVAYTFTVVAINVAGTGPASAPSLPVTPLAVPTAPTGLAVTAGVGSATLTFTPVAASFAATYIATCYSSYPTSVVFTATGPSSPIIVTGLSSGVLYGCSVTATNSSGTSASSAVVAVAIP